MALLELLIKTVLQGTEQIDGLSKKLGGLSSGLQGTGTNLLALTAPMAVASGAMFNLGADFGAVTNRIQAVTGATADDIQKITDKALQLGKDLPISAKDAADGMYALSTAGFSTNEVLAASEGVARLASSQQVSLGNAAELTAATLRGFKIDVGETNTVIDQLSQVVSISAAEMPDLAETIKYIGPVAGAAGQSLNDMGTAIALMADVGVKGSMAGTALRATLLRLIAPPKEAADALKRMQIQVTDGSAGVIKTTKELDKTFSGFKKSFTEAGLADALKQAFTTLGFEFVKTKKGLIDIGESTKLLRNIMDDSNISVEKKNQALAFLGDTYTKSGGKMLPFIQIAEQFREKMAGMSESEKTATAASIVGQEAVAGFLAIVNASPEAFEKMKSGMAGAEGATEKFSNAMNKGAKFEMEQLKGSIETLIISGFLKLQPTIEDTIKSLTGFVNKAIDWMAANPELVKQLGVLILGFGTIGPIIGGVMLALSALLSPITLVAGAVALLAYAWMNNWGDIQGKTAVAVAYLQTLWTALQSDLARVGTFINDILIPTFTVVWTWLSENLALATSQLSLLWNETLLPALNAVWVFIRDNVIPLLGALGNVWLALVQKETEALAGLWNNVLLPGLRTVAAFITDTVIPKLTEWANIIQTVVGPALSWFIDNVIIVLQRNMEGIVNGIKTAIEWLNRLAEAIRNFQLPEFLQRKSPSPFEQTFWGAAEAIKAARLELDGLSNVTGGFNVGLGQRLALGGNTGNTSYNINIQTGDLRSDLDLDRLAYRVATVISKRQR